MKLKLETFYDTETHLYVAKYIDETDRQIGVSGVGILINQAIENCKFLNNGLTDHG